MACIEISDRMAILLKCLTLSLPEDDLVHLRRTPEWIQARASGWVTESGELVGKGPELSASLAQHSTEASHSRGTRLSRYTVPARKHPQIRQKEHHAKGYSNDL
jgi:hypothetical protein